MLLSQPGFSIYGHWVLDLVPRLHLLSQAALPPGLDFYLGHLPEWAHGFLEAFGIRPDRVRSLPPGLNRFRRALSPSATKSGHRLGQPIAREAWLRVKHFADTVNRRSPGTLLPRPRKIFISRDGWPDKQREIANIAQLTRIAAENGYYILRPEMHSLFEQAEIFRRAEAIVGEDGSGLHNIIFSEPGCVLGVIGVAERLNLWHLGICKALGHRAAYIEADVNANAERVIDVSSFRQMLSAIEASMR